jgi:transposase
VVTGVQTCALPIYKESSQMVVMSELGELLLEMKVATQAQELRRVVGGIAGPKQVVFEEGPLSGMIRDALEGVADQIVSADPSQNALIARSEDSNDEKDARRLGTLAVMKAIREVYVPAEPYRTLRSLLAHDERLAGAITSVKNRIKALCRRRGIGCRGTGVYRAAGRPRVLEQLPAELKWQMESLYRQLDLARGERVGAHRVLGRLTRKMPLIARLDGIPGVGPVTARTLAGWIVDPDRFKNRNAINAYAGLGLSQGVTNWKVVSRARASKRGQKRLKRVLMIAAEAALKGDNALARRYRARREVGWDERKAKRDVARTMLFVACGMWKNSKEYDDGLVRVPAPPQKAARAD